MKNRSINFVLVNFYRDLRAGNLTLLLFSLIIAVSSISCISFLSDRVKQSLDKDMQSSLGADRRLVSDRPIPGKWIVLADKLGVDWAQGTRFPSMIIHQDSSKLVSVKAVTKNYPLKGNLEINTLNGLAVNPILGNDEAWIDPSLIEQLNLKINDEINIGDKKLKVSGVVVHEPDRGINFVNFAPRIFINNQILPETGLIQAGSRVSYRLWLATSKTESLVALDSLITKELGLGQRMDTVETARPDLNEAFEKANSFLSLIGMITVLMSAVAIALASKQLASSQKKGFALMQALGCGFRMLRKIAISELSLTLILGVLVGCLVGFLAQVFLGWFLIKYSSINLPSLEVPSLWIFFQAMIVAVLLVLTSAWPSFYKVFKSNPISTLRLDKKESFRKKFINKENCYAYLILSCGILCMLYVITNDLELAVLVSFGFVVIALVFFILCGVFLKFISLIDLSFLLNNFPELNWCWLSFKRAAKRRGASISAQIIGLGLSIAALSTSAFIQNDLVNIWENLLPVDAPNNFVINIQQDQKAELKTFLSSYDVEDVNIYPMVKARLTRINQKKLLPEDYVSMSTRRLLKREINLSYGKKIPSHNKIIVGEELDSGKFEVSVEEGFAKNFGIKLNDLLEFDIAGEKLDVTVSSIRALKWESMEVNFFMFLSDLALKDKPQTAVTAFYLKPIETQLSNFSSNKVEQSITGDFKNRLLNQFSNLTVVDTDLIAKQVRRLITQSVFAVQFLFLFCLIAGCLVLWSSLLSSRKERVQEIVFLRSLGASANQLAFSQWFELLLIGFLSGFTATGMAQVFAKIVALHTFDINLIFNFSPLLIGGVVGACFSLASGSLALRGILSTPAIDAMREIS